MKITDITPTNIRNFIEGNFNYYIKKPKNLPNYQYEQAQYRAFLCKECAAAKKCHSCSCSVPNLFYAPNKTDAGGKWGPMVSEEEWIKFKQTETYGNYLASTKDDVRNSVSDINNDLVNKTTDNK